MAWCGLCGLPFIEHRDGECPRFDVKISGPHHRPSDLPDAVRRSVGAPDVETVIEAWADGGLAPVGYLIYRAVNATTVLVWVVVVHPNLWRRGIATAMADYVRDVLGFALVFDDDDPDNTAAGLGWIAAYRRRLRLGKGVQQGQRRIQS